MAMLRDLTGQTFGYLTVLGPGAVHTSPCGRASRKWRCLCVCGNVKEIQADHLIRTKKPTKSCGCMSRALDAAGHTKHGMTDSKLYSIWNQMRQRCANPKDKSWARYGGRGIRVCDRWQTSFQNFLDDMGPTWKPGLQIERLDNSAGYSPENCIWATRSQQGRNKRNNIRVSTPLGDMTLAELAERVGLKYGTLQSRYYRKKPLLSAEEEERLRHTT